MNHFSTPYFSLMARQAGDSKLTMNLESNKLLSLLHRNNGTNRGYCEKVVSKLLEDLRVNIYATCIHEWKKKGLLSSIGVSWNYSNKTHHFIYLCQQPSWALEDGP